MTLLEVAVITVIIGALLGISFSSMQNWQANERASAAARSLGDLFRFASTEATRNESVQILFFAIAGNGDTVGNTLVDPAGNPVPVLLLDDGAVGSANQNCQIDAGEPIHVLAGNVGVGWGFAVSAGAKAPGDATAIATTTGSSFATPTGAASTWVAFMPDGRPLGFDAACSMGQLGSGNGAVYITNGSRDYAIVLNPLGGIRIHAWNSGAGQWQI
jgi:type II secretory pathway pseudopilin PulG